jgi:hypothetical protein
MHTVDGTLVDGERLSGYHIWGEFSIELSLAIHPHLVP